MPTFRKILWSFLSLIALLIGQAGLAEAAALTIAGEWLNLRSGPGRAYAILGIVHQNERYEILEEQAGWYRIEANGKMGWVSATGVKLPSSGKIQELLARADDYLLRQQFTTPPGENAFDLYMQALQEDPDNAHARKRIAQIAKTYKQWADVAYQADNRQKARVFYERYLHVAPGDKAIEARLKELENPATAAASLRILRLRAQPATLSAAQVVALIQAARLNHPADWSKSGLSPSLTGDLRHDYTVSVSQGASVILDYATQLMWQPISLKKPVAWRQAFRCADQLNAAQSGGFVDWRLPTLEELASLLEPRKTKHGLYLSPLFGAAPLWCWSADASSEPQRAWYVSFNSGGAQQQDVENPAFVLAVRTHRPD